MSVKRTNEDGAIYSTTNNAGDEQPIAECDNCSRVNKYVVTYGARLDANALVQMRVHDVNVLGKERNYVREDASFQ